jgi:hypothetical protein
MPNRSEQVGAEATRGYAALGGVAADRSTWLLACAWGRDWLPRQSSDLSDAETSLGADICGVRSGQTFGMLLPCWLEYEIGTD